MRAARRVLFLLVGLVVWLPQTHRLFVVDDAERARIRDDLLRAEVGPVTPMRGVNPEWDFMARTFRVLALVNIALDADEPRKAELLARIDAIIDGTREDVEAHGQAHFLLGYGRANPFVDPAGRSVFVDGEILVMMAAREIVAPLARELRADSLARAARIEAAMRASPSLSAESYPNECWTFCNTTALVGLTLLDHVEGSDHGALRRAWVANARQHLVDPKTGILVSSYAYGGATLDGPEGSSIWMSAHNLLFVDDAFARDQYARARRELGVEALGFGWAREWPKSADARPDIDSGSIVPLLDASAGSSGLALLGAAAFEDRSWQRSLFTSLELAGFRKDGRYLAGNRVGDAVTLYALSFGPLLERIRARRTS